MSTETMTKIGGKRNKRPVGVGPSISEGGGPFQSWSDKSWRKALLNIGVALFALFLVWDNPVDIDGELIPQSAVKEYRVYVDGILKATVLTPEVPLDEIGLSNKKSATVDMVLHTGEVSPQSNPLVRIVPGGGPSGVEIESRP